MAAETYTQVAADGPGKKIRNLQVTLLQADGTPATVQMQVIALSDEAGNVLLPLAARDFEAWGLQLLAELQAVRQILAIVTKVRL